MPSRLSSLLVRDSLVGVKRMEKAFQRQVIYGGSLDTILLEMQLVPEERLTQYLALASGLPPAARDEGSHIQPEATLAIPRELAEQYRAVPLAVDGEAIRVLVCAPLEITELEDLADRLDRPLQPLIGPEYRWHLVFAAAYGTETPARFTTLARSLDIDPTTPPVGRSRSVIVDESRVPVSVNDEVTSRGEKTPDVLAPISPSDATMKIVVDVPLADPTKRTTLPGVRAQTETGMPEPRRPRRDGVPEEPLVPPRVTFTKPAAKPKRVASSPISTVGNELPLSVIRARELLAVAEDRDSVFLTLLRAARSRARWAGLLTVQGGAAIGRVALAEAGVDTAAIESVLIPLDSVSPFRAVVGGRQAHIGPLSSGDPAIDSMVLRMGGTMPPSALIMPIVLRDRVVALVVAHRVFSDIKLVDVTELLPMATAASDAIGRLIVRHKAAGYRTPAESGVVDFVNEVETKRMPRQESPWAAPDPEVVTVFDGATDIDVPYVAEPLRPIDEVIAEIENAKDTTAENAIAEAIERPNEALGALMRLFPGRLRVDRFAVQGRSLRATQYGGLLELVVRLGSVASELLIEKMSAPQRDIRFYATICAAELRPRNAVFALVERLFDQDFGVRATAIEALAGYPMHDLAQALVRARRAIHSNDPEVVGAATAAIVTLGDVEAIGDLIGAVERSDRGGDHARRALTALTAQDFGTSERKWRKWHEGAHRQHRIEWLIAGLGHKEDAIRELAINDLRRLTGEYFGYHHDLPRREREIAAERWVTWWREAGQRRFTPVDDERIRPTAQLPARREP